ncbi:MAG: Ca2+-dependent phosphoinositide-specific phospholipase C, partial [Halioglobus sp.]|nr:Ca2+-dependent phosphoinositide-specific phospholipase C [Halioglobus sp.]
MTMTRSPRCARPALALLVALALVACGDSRDGDDTSPNPAAALRINELQYLGTHNSYKMRIRDDLFALLQAFVPDIAPTLEYSHVPLTEQFDMQGIRQIELDIFYDPDGGLYANRNALPLVGEAAASGLPELDAPGHKVLHVQEIDYETTCLTFVLCLQEIRAWSDRNPYHLPITVLVEAKDGDLPVDTSALGFVVPLPFGREALDRIDVEIRSVFEDDRLILPDHVRGDAATLE